MEKRERCYALLVNEFQNVLQRDNGLIQAQLTLTAMKLAKRIAKLKGVKKLSPYANYLANVDLVRRLNEDSGSLETLAKMRQNYLESNKTIIDPLGDINQQLMILMNSEKLSDDSSAFLVAAIMSSEDHSEFDEYDAATAWFVNQASKNYMGTDSFHISDLVKTVIEYSEEGDDELAAKNIAKASLNLKAALAKVKEKVFEANKQYCVGDYKDSVNAQNRSVFQSCRMAEEEIIQEAFLDSIQKVIQSPELFGFKSNPRLPASLTTLADSKKVRSIQDELNSEKYNDHQRVVEYYRQGLYPNKEGCDTFVVVDKKKQQTSVYTTDGNEIFSTNSVQAFPRTGKNQTVFNPDSELRKFENGSYTRTTSAGVFYNILDMDPEVRKQRKYDEEFDDRVLVISPRYEKDGKYEYDDTVTIALHGVPINGWVKNAKQRLDSFDGGNRNLSTGCVNLEGYAYDLIEELSQNHCPMYILPQDDKNYFHIKNRELKFSTSVIKRKDGAENAKKCLDGKVVLKRGEASCEGGKWVNDKDNINRYYFSLLSNDIYATNVTVDGPNSSVVDRLWAERENLVNSITAKNIDGEDLEDLIALTHSVSDGADEAIDKFKDLYNSYYSLKSTKGINFDLLSKEEKRKKILKYYLDPQGFEKSRKDNQKSVYAPIDRAINIEQAYKKSEDVRFYHEM